MKKYIGRLDIAKYQLVTSKRIMTDTVKLTDNRREHIIQRRGQEFYDKYSSLFADVISDPDYIFRDEKDNTALAAKTLMQNGESINIVLRLAVEGDDPEYKNSIITAIRENDKRFAQRLRNNIPVYKRLDKSE